MYPFVAEYSLPLSLAAVGYLFMVLAYRGIRRRKVMGIGGAIEPSSVQYYLRVGAYLLGSGFLLVLAGMKFHQELAWKGLTLFLLALAVLIWIPLGFRAGVKRLFRWITKPRTRRSRRRRQKSQSKEGPTPREWALATVAMLSKVEGKDYFLLGGAEPNERKSKLARKRLTRDWDIRDADQFVEESEWLFEEGHRKEFQEMIQRVSQFSETELTQYESEIDAGKYDLHTEAAKADERQRVKMAKDNLQDIRFLSFMAWDYLRFIQLIREGFLGEYVEEEEAWSRIFSAAQVLQSRYDSWEEMNRSFLLAREFWSQTETQREGDVYRRALAQLLHDENSPLHSIPWELPLYTR